MWWINYQQTIWGYDEDDRVSIENVFTDQHPFVFIRERQKKYKGESNELISFVKLTEEDIAVARELGLVV